MSSSKPLFVVSFSRFLVFSFCKLLVPSRSHTLIARHKPTGRSVSLPNRHVRRPRLFRSWAPVSTINSRLSSSNLTLELNSDNAVGCGFASKAISEGGLAPEKNISLPYTRQKRLAVLRRLSTPLQKNACRRERWDHGQMAIMCFQIVEVYAFCGCERRRYAVDPCSSVSYVGQQGHHIVEKRLELGFACYFHMMRKNPDLLAPNQPNQAVPATQEAPAVPHTDLHQPHLGHASLSQAKEGPDGSPSPPSSEQLYGVSQPIPIPQRKKSDSYPSLRASR